MSPSPWQLLVVLLIVLVIFGTKKLRNLGGDLGSAIKSFRSAVKEGGEKEKQDDAAQLEEPAGSVIEGEVSNKERDSA